MKTVNNTTAKFMTSEANGKFYSYAEWTYKNSVYSFCIDTWDHNKGLVNGFTKRNNYAGSSNYGTAKVFSESKFVEQYEKHGASGILAQMKQNLIEAMKDGHRITDNAPIPA